MFMGMGMGLVQAKQTSGGSGFNVIDRNVILSAFQNGQRTGTGPYNYGATANDCYCYTADYNIPLASDGSTSVVLTATSLTVVFLQLNYTNVATQEFDVAPYEIALSGGSYGAYQAGAAQVLNVKPNPPSASVGDVIRLRKIGTSIVMEVKPIGTGIWQMYHIFPAAPTGTLYPALRIFNSGQIVNSMLLSQGQAQTRLTNAQTNVTFDGNSLFARDPGSGPVATRFSYNAPIIGSSVTVNNLAVDGQNTEAMIADHSDIDASFNAGRTNNVLVLWEGTNSIFPTQSDTAAQAITAMTNYITAVRAVHPTWKIILLTTIPRQNGFADGATLTTFNQTLDIYNATILSTFATMGADRVCDVRQAGSPFNFGGVYTAATFTTAGAYYFDISPNMLHLSDLGAQLIANYITATLNTLSLT